MYNIFTDVKIGKKPIRDAKLLVFVAALLLVNVAVLIAWGAADARKITEIEIDSVETKDYTLVTLVEHCKSEFNSVFIGIILGVQGLLLVFGTFLAFETRKVAIFLNDSGAFR